MFPCLYFTVNVDFGSFSGRVRHRPKDWFSTRVCVWHYKIVALFYSN